MPVAPRPRQPRRWAASLAVASLLAVQTSSLRAVQAAAANAADAPLEPLLVLDSAPARDWLAHPLDAGFARALAMLPARLAELPDEIPDYEGPDGATLALLARTLLEQPHRLAVALQGADPQTGQPHVVAALDIGVRDEADARTLQTLVTQLLQQSGQVVLEPAGANDDLLEAMTPIGPVRFGPSRSDAGAWRWSLRLGQAVDADALFAALGRAPGDGSQLLRFHLSLAPLKGLFTGFLQMQAQLGAAPPFMQQLLDLFKIRMDVSVQRTGDHLLSRVRLLGARSVQQVSVLDGAPLTAEDFAPIPRDATVAGALRVHLSRATQDLLLPLKASPLTASWVERFETAAGLSLENDLLPALGDTIAFYATTSALTPVMALRVGDAAAMRRVMTGLSRAANEQLADAVPPDGPAAYVRFRHSDVNGVDVVSLLFPGAPMPLAPTAALVDDWLLVSLTPEAISGAVDQLRHRRPSLASLPSVQRALASKPLVGYSFLPATSNIAAGYGLSTLLASAFANAVRSPVDPTREPGLLLPPLDALTRDVRPAERLTYWEGDDLVFEGRAPASVAQSLPMTVGVLARSVSLGLMQGVLGAIASTPQTLHTMLQTRRQLDHIQRAIEDTRPLFEIATAMARYAHEHKGRYPDNFQALVDGGYAQADLLDSAVDWAGDGQGDFFIRFGGHATTPPNPVRLLAYSRAAYAVGDTVPVVFEDGTPKLLSLPEFFQILDNPVNKDVDWRLPRRIRDKKPDFMLAPARLSRLSRSPAPSTTAP